MLSYILLASCSNHVVTGGFTPTPKRDDCPYQRLKFVGSSNVNAERGIQLLDSLSLAINLEKTGLETGTLDNRLGVKVANLTKEVGNFAVPIKQEEAADYVRLSNGICTIRHDLYNGLFKDDPDLRREALKTYIEMINVVDGLKKKLESN